MVGLGMCLKSRAFGFVGGLDVRAEDKVVIGAGRWSG